MARSFSYDHYRDNKRDDRSALRKAERKAYTQNPPEPEREGPLHGRGPQAQTRRLWRELHEGERQQRASVEAQAARVPIGALPTHEELPEEVHQDASRESGRKLGRTRQTRDRQGGAVSAFEAAEGPPDRMRDARAQLGTLGRSLGEAAGALARLLRIPVEAIRARDPQPQE